MTIMEYVQGDIVLFTDTGREHQKTYEFIDRFEQEEKIPVTRISYKNSENGFNQLIEEKNFSALPNRVKRFCTERLKIRTARKFLVDNGIKSYQNFIGFRYDEKSRVEGYKTGWRTVLTYFPLYHKHITKAQVNDYWAKKSYNLEIPAILGNCTLCPLKGQNSIMAILASFPELADPSINDERQSEIRNPGAGRTYLPGITIEKLKNIAQNNLFKDYDLTQARPAFNCSCTA